MEYRSLGSTGMKVSEIGFGAWAIGGDAWGPVEDDASIAAMQRALELGINFIDTADVYGDGQAWVRKDMLVVAMSTIPAMVVERTFQVKRKHLYSDSVDRWQLASVAEAAIRQLGFQHVSVLVELSEGDPTARPSRRRDTR